MIHAIILTLSICFAIVCFGSLIMALVYLPLIFSERARQYIKRSTCAKTLLYLESIKLVLKMILVMLGASTFDGVSMILNIITILLWLFNYKMNLKSEAIEEFLKNNP